MGFRILPAMLLAAILAGGATASIAAPIPSADEQARAEKLLDQAIGDEMAAAKSPEEKIALVEEILRVVEEETDPANKYVALRATKRLAAEAGNGKRALEVVHRLVAAFDAPEARSQDEWLAAADRAWEVTEQAKGTEKLAGRLGATEMWLRAAVDEPTGLLAIKWRVRVEAIEAGVEPPKEEPKLSPVSRRTLQLLRALHGSRVLIVNRHSELAVHVFKGKKSSGAHLIQWSHSPKQPNAQWDIEVIDGRWCRFRNVTSGLWLGVTGNDTVIRAVQTPLRDTENDWELQWVDGQFVAIRHRNTGLYLGPKDGSKALGTGIHLYPFNPDTHHLQWRFMPVKK